MLIREIKRRAHHFLGPSAAICLVAYFSYHLLEGRRGIFAWQRFEIQLLKAQDRLTKLKQEESMIANRVRLLKSESICTDLLIERAKEILGYVPSHEIVVPLEKK